MGQVQKSLRSPDLHTVQTMVLEPETKFQAPASIPPYKFFWLFSSSRPGRVDAQAHMIFIRTDLFGVVIMPCLEMLVGMFVYLASSLEIAELTS